MDYFISDTHNNHANIIKYCNRPFNNIQEMEIYMVDKINQIVGTTDTLYHLGDVEFARGGKPFGAFLEKLNCQNIILLLGNHDPKKLKPFKSIGLIEVHHYLEIKFNKIPIVLSHYPFYSWNNKSHGSCHLFGHCHATYKPQNMRCIDVGVDNIGYEPLTIQKAVDLCITNGGDNPQSYP